MNNQKAKNAIRLLWTRMSGHFFVGRTRVVSDNPQWAGFTTKELAQCEKRISRLGHEYLLRYRRSGNLRLPEIHEVKPSAVYTRCEVGRTEMTVQQAAASLSRAKIDVLMRTILMQLIQLESIGYIHGALEPKRLIIKCRSGIWRAEITGLECGHFTDETFAIPQPDETDYLSPEGYRRKRYAGNNSMPEVSDVFSAGCIYYHLLTGKEMAAPAEALDRMQPLCVKDVVGPHGGLIRWMLEPNEVKRPDATDVMDAMDEMQSLGLLEQEWAIGERIQMEEYQAEGQQIGPDHAENQRIVMDGGGGSADDPLHDGLLESR
ncbi:MAG: hypothetical protein Q4E13_05610 [Clostridia bacterium]|nr:hypothetical protein [Clostridia bacterium]